MARLSPPGGGGGTLCFHPGDDNKPTARHSQPGGGGAACFHPSDDGSASMTHLADDLAADLHLALASIDYRQLAVLA
ncbi:hypothetical protein [Catellatospora sp. IY07-71]|uniref:hypothetical protein n=1 Tax=Catellatospora sp. IY07-71 TaxID=2728827 RepID=UPI001BB3D472|nr:hypothetical protein [Catellatospora sp. IY07-71]